MRSTAAAAWAATRGCSPRRRLAGSDLSLGFEDIAIEMSKAVD
jgi:hypothetical protein